MVRASASFVFGIVLMVWGASYFILGCIYWVPAMIFWSFVPFFIGYTLVLSEVIISRENNKDRGGGDG
jgi:hypothetical protein